MNSLRALWRHDRAVLVTGTLFLLAGLAFGLFVPLPAHAAAGEPDPVGTLERESWIWMAIVAVVVVGFVVGCWLIDWATARRDCRSRTGLDAEKSIPILSADDERWALSALYPNTKAPGAEAVRPGATTSHRRAS